jgi:hypothetical protein
MLTIQNSGRSQVDIALWIHFFVFGSLSFLSFFAGSCKRSKGLLKTRSQGTEAKQYFECRNHDFEGRRGKRRSYELELGR